MLAPWRVISNMPVRPPDDCPTASRRRISNALQLAACMVVLGWCQPLAAQEEELFDEEPYDQLTLDAANDNVVLKVKPLDLPDRLVPQPFPRRGALQARLLDDPRKLYEVPWLAIDKIELFEQLVLKKAESLVKAGKFDRAYDYFVFLGERYPDLPGLDPAMEDYLFQEARALYLKGKYDGSLALLRELYRRNPQRPKLDGVLGATTEKLVQEYLAGKNYSAARTLLRNLKVSYPEHPVVVRHEGELKQQAAALLAEARAKIEDGDLRTAARLVDRLRGIWPALPGAQELTKSIHREYPRVVVGVSLPAVEPQPERLDDWAARRSARLVYRTLTELVGPGSEGGRYECPVGEMIVEILDRRITLQIEPGIRWSSGEAVLTGYDVSRRLLAMADPRDAAYRAGWAELLGGVAVANVYRVDAQLRLPHVRPEALLQTILVPYTTAGDSGGRAVPNGPYVIDSRSGQQTHYLANARYFDSQPAQPREIIERYYPRGTEAVRALKAGRIQVLDRVNPLHLNAVRQDEDLVVQSYAMPLVHCLIPNMRRPLVAHRAFRRALVYGIDRQAILDQLLGGAESVGCGVLGGPFAARLSLDDPISYARDPNVVPRAYDPRLAIALAEVGRREVAAAQRKQRAAKEEQGESKATAPRLVLAHPPHELARVACTAIGRQLEPIGITVELRELSGALPARIPEDVDLLYAELAMWEPLVDAPRLLGEDGPAAACSPYMSLAFRQLRQAGEWPQARQILRRIHRLAHDEVAIVPLWQLTEHLAYHKSLRGIGARPVCLYQNVEQWQNAFQYPVE